MKYLLILMTALTIQLYANSAQADCSGTDFSHVESCEHFKLFDDPSQTAHFWFGIASTTTLSLALQKFGMKPIPAVLTAIAVTSLMAAGKEALIDQHTSKNGILSTWSGAAVGGTVSLVILSF